MIPKKINILIQLITVIVMPFIFFLDIAICNGEYLKAPDPHKYKNPSELWEHKASEENCMLSLWYVFADRDDLQLYKTSKGLENVTSVNFLDKFKVRDLKNHYFHVEAHDNSDIVGWGRVEQFIILPHAVKTKNSITHKAVLINPLGSVEGNVNIVDPLRKPIYTATTKKTNKRIKILEFAHIYSYFTNENSQSYILIGKAPYFYPGDKKNEPFSIQNIILGWVPADRIYTWDTREALEPNIKRKHPIYYFKNKGDIISYYQAHQKDDDQKPDEDLLVILPDTEKKIDRTPWPSKMFRYAILEKNDDPKKPFKIGVTSAKLNERILDSIVTNVFETVRKNSNNRDVVFLIDATMSMGPYLELAGKISKEIMDKFRDKKQKKKEEGTLRFGVALYRDYKNQNNVFEIDKKSGFLTVDVEKTKEYLENLTPKRSYENDKDDPAYYPEAVFQGIIRCIKDMNWKPNSRRLIIHIGDAGNHSRNNDNYNTNDIADKLSTHDISYSAIQIENDSLDLNKIKAQRSFCNQTRLIIKNIIQKTLASSEKYKDSKTELSRNLSEPSLTSDLKEKKCISCGNDRWQLSCIKTSQTGLYEKTIEKQINKLAKEAFDAKVIIDEYRRGLSPQTEVAQKSNQQSEIIAQSKDNVSFSPLLMPGIVKSLKQEIGQDMLNKSNDVSVKNKIIEYIGKTDFDQLNREADRTKAIQTIGEKELKRYLEKDVRFFTKAYVMLKKPGTNYPAENNQLTKKIFFQKKELERLIYPLDRFKHKYSCQINLKNLKILWTEFLLAILGEDPSFMEKDTIRKNDSASLLYEQQFGISLRNSHPLLKMKFSDIIHGKFLNSKDIEELETYLCKAYTKLKKIYDDENSYYRIFGNEYIWVDASVLP